MCLKVISNKNDVSFWCFQSQTTGNSLRGLFNVSVCESVFVCVLERERKIDWKRDREQFCAWIGDFWNTVFLYFCHCCSISSMWANTSQWERKIGRAVEKTQTQTQTYLFPSNQSIKRFGQQKTWNIAGADFDQLKIFIFLRNNLI
jgi:hypothetical protein